MLNITTLAARLGVKESLIRQMVFRREIPHYKVSRLMRFNENEINQWRQMRSVNYKGNLNHDKNNRTN